MNQNLQLKMWGKKSRKTSPQNRGCHSDQCRPISSNISRPLLHPSSNFESSIQQKQQKKKQVLGSKMQPGSCWALLGHSCRPQDDKMSRTNMWFFRFLTKESMSKLSTVFLESEGVRIVRIASNVGMLDALVSAPFPVATTNPFSINKISIVLR